MLVLHVGLLQSSERLAFDNVFRRRVCKNLKANWTEDQPGIRQST